MNRLLVVRCLTPNKVYHETPMSLFNEDRMRKGSKSLLYAAFSPLPAASTFHGIDVMVSQQIGGAISTLPQIVLIELK